MATSDPDFEPVGYTAIIDRYRLRVIKPYLRCFTAPQGGLTVERTAQHETRVYPHRYRPDPELPKQLRFALRYEGVELAVLAALFDEVGSTELERWVRSEPTGSYARRAWFLYEWLRRERLDLPDLARGSYVDAIDPSQYFTAEPLHSRRHMVRDNLPGVPGFCPLVRRTRVLQRFVASQFDERFRVVVAGADSVLLQRAVEYLYTKETKSSFAIERETPTDERTRRFVRALRNAEHNEVLSESDLTEIQSRIVDPRFAETGYRTRQNYVGESLGWNEEKVHFVCPRPQDVRSLMNALVDSHRRIMASGEGSSPVVHAAVIAFGFVYIHPFEDGNGRIHRLLVHHVLARRGFTPPGIVLPVSSVILNDPRAYDAALEAFSRPLMDLVEYDIDQAGAMTVDGNAAMHFRYIDLTKQAEALAAFVQRAIEVDLVHELEFLRRYDQAAEAVRKVVDLPDRLLALMLRLLHQGHGRLSRAKRSSHFGMLSDGEIERIEAAFDEILGG